jgi:hypothetical protein
VLRCNQLIYVTGARDGRRESVGIRLGNDDSRSYNSDRRASQRERGPVVGRLPGFMVQFVIIKLIFL